MTPEELLNVGSLYDIADIKIFASNHSAVIHSTKENSPFRDSDGQIRRAEFFGKNLLDKLLNSEVTGKEVYGIRIHYGLAWEDDDATEKSGLSLHQVTPKSNLRPRLFLVPVDKDGKDIVFDITGKGGDTTGGGGNGSTCPKNC